MTTLETLNAHGETLINKLKAGQILSKEERSVLKIYNSLHAGKSFNAGQRRSKEKIQKIN